MEISFVTRESRKLLAAPLDLRLLQGLLVPLVYSHCQVVSYLIGRDYDSKLPDLPLPLPRIQHRIKRLLS